MYIETFTLGQLEDTFNKASITLILQHDKEPTEPCSFQPVILIDTDSKVRTKVLATRIESVLPQVIHKGQVGFVKGEC